jgi:hypothetical protein
VQHFEYLIRQNFLLKGAGLLRSCEAYLEGAPVSLFFLVRAKDVQ